MCKRERERERERELRMQAVYRNGLRLDPSASTASVSLAA